MAIKVTTGQQTFVKNDRATKAWYTWQERTGRTCIEGDFVAGNVAIIEKVKDEAA